MTSNLSSRPEKNVIDLSEKEVIDPYVEYRHAQNKILDDTRDEDEADLVDLVNQRIGVADSGQFIDLTMY